MINAFNASRRVANTLKREVKEAYDNNQRSLAKTLKGMIPKEVEFTPQQAKTYYGRSDTRFKQTARPPLPALLIGGIEDEDGIPQIAVGLDEIRRAYDNRGSCPRELQRQLNELVNTVAGRQVLTNADAYYANIKKGLPKLAPGIRRYMGGSIFDFIATSELINSVGSFCRELWSGASRAVSVASEFCQSFWPVWGNDLLVSSAFAGACYETLVQVSSMVDDNNAILSQTPKGHFIVSDEEFAALTTGLNDSAVESATHSTASVDSTNMTTFSFGTCRTGHTTRNVASYATGDFSDFVHVIGQTIQESFTSLSNAFYGLTLGDGPQPIQIGVVETPKTMLDLVSLVCVEELIMTTPTMRYVFATAELLLKLNTRGEHAWISIVPFFLHLLNTGSFGKRVLRHAVWNILVLNFTPDGGRYAGGSIYEWFSIWLAFVRNYLAMLPGKLEQFCRESEHVPSWAQFASGSINLIAERFDGRNIFERIPAVENYDAHLFTPKIGSVYVKFERVDLNFGRKCLNVLDKGKWVILGCTMLAFCAYNATSMNEPPNLGDLPFREASVLTGRTYDSEGLPTIRGYRDSNGNYLTTDYALTRTWFLENISASYVEYQFVRFHKIDEDRRMLVATQTNALPSWMAVCKKREVNSLFTRIFDIRSEITINLTLVCEHLRPASLSNNTQALTASICRSTSVNAGLHERSTGDTIDFANMIASSEAKVNGTGPQTTCTGLLRAQKSAGLSMTHTRVHPTSLEEIQSVTFSLLLGCPECDLGSQGLFPSWPTPISRTLSTQSLVVLTASAVLFNQDALLSSSASVNLQGCMSTPSFQSLTTLISTPVSMLTELTATVLKRTMTSFIKLQLLSCFLIGSLTAIHASTSLNPTKLSVHQMLPDSAQTSHASSLRHLIPCLHNMAPFSALVMRLFFTTLANLSRLSPYETVPNYLNRCSEIAASSRLTTQDTNATTLPSLPPPQPIGLTVPSSTSTEATSSPLGTATSSSAASSTSGASETASPPAVSADSPAEIRSRVQRMAFSIVSCPATCEPTLMHLGRACMRLYRSLMPADHSLKGTMEFLKEVLSAANSLEGWELISKPNASFMLDSLNSAGCSNLLEFMRLSLTQREPYARCMSLVEGTFTRVKLFAKVLSRARRDLTTSNTLPAQ
jgi:hypothetical protein